MTQDEINIALCDYLRKHDLSGAKILISQEYSNIAQMGEVFLYECLEVLLILSIKNHDTRLFLKVFKEITNLGTADKILDFFLRRKRVLAKYTKEKKHKAEEWNSVLYLNRTKDSEKGKKTRPNRYPLWYSSNTTLFYSKDSPSLSLELSFFHFTIHKVIYLVRIWGKTLIVGSDDSHYVILLSYVLK